MRSDERRPVNVGNPKERTVGEIAELVIELSAARALSSTSPSSKTTPRGDVRT